MRRMERRREGRLKKRERKSGERSERMKLSTTSNLYITLWPSLGLTYIHNMHTSHIHHTHFTRATPTSHIHHTHFT